MNTVQVAKKHRKIRDEAFTKKLLEAIALLNKHDLEDALILHLMDNYQPKDEIIIKKVEEQLNNRVQNITEENIEELVKSMVESIFDDKLEEKVSEIVNRELLRRLKFSLDEFDDNEY